MTAWRACLFLLISSFTAFLLTTKHGFDDLRDTSDGTPTAEDLASSESLNAEASSPAIQPKLLVNEGLLPGEYYFGDGLGVNCLLTLRKDHTFAFEWHGCLGVYDRNRGNWRIEGELVILEPKEPYEQKGFRGLNTRFLPIQWGARLCLVDENQMPGFCVLAGKESAPTEEFVHRFGQHYVKKDKVGKESTKTIPLIPDRFRSFLEHGPVEVTVTEKTTEGSFILDTTAPDRLWVGIPLCRKEGGRSELEVTSVDGRRVKARAVYFWNSDRSDTVKMGDRFWTGGTWRNPRGTSFQRFYSIKEAIASGRSENRDF